MTPPPSTNGKATPTVGKDGSTTVPPELRALQPPQLAALCVLAAFGRGGLEDASSSYKTQKQWGT